MGSAPTGMGTCSACAARRPWPSKTAVEKSRLELRICEEAVRSMASPISCTMDSRRCWMTETVMRSSPMSVPPRRRRRMTSLSVTVHQRRPRGILRRAPRLRHVFLEEDAMSFDALEAGAVLPDFHVSAATPAEPSENRVHQDDMAQKYGFKGGLVPGVIMYAWMTHPVVAALGPAWLERGLFETRFPKPIYYEEPATIRGGVAAKTSESVTIEVVAHNSVDEVCGTARMTLSLADHSSPPPVADYAAAPLPAERPRVTRAHLERLAVLGTPELDLDAKVAAEHVTRFGDPLDIYAGAGAALHP